MNIWIFNHYAVGPKSTGGTRHFDLATELVKRGHNVTIFASSFNHFLKKEMVKYGKGTYAANESIDNVNYIWIKTIKYQGSIKRIMNIADYTLKAYKIAKKEMKKNEPDIIIGSSVHPLAAYVGYLISKEYKKVYYFEERDLWPQTFVDFGKLKASNPVAKIMYIFEKKLYDNAERIIVLFNKAPEYVISKGINPEKVIYLPNGVNLSNYVGVKRDHSMFDKLKNYKYKVVYTGSHGTANYLEPFIEAANILQNKMGNKEIQFILVGNGLLKDKLIQSAKNYNLKNVTFLDPIPKNKIPFLLQQSDLSFISLKKSPLYKWGFSMNKIYDYMASGLPIMVYSSEEVVGNFKNVYGVKLSETTHGLAQNILESIYDENFKEEAKKSLKQHVKNNYAWDRLVLKIESYMIKDVQPENSTYQEYNGGG